MTKHKTKYVLAFFGLINIASVALAQTPSSTDAVPTAPAAEAAAPTPAQVAEAEAAAKAQAEALKTPFNKSLFFTELELASIQRAIQQVSVSTGVDTTKTPYIPPQRQIKVSGVLNRGPGDWVVWINGKKIIPSQLLPEIIDIKVVDDAVRLKWYDVGMNKIISITLRPHQTFDIVTGLLLPG